MRDVAEADLREAMRAFVAPDLGRGIAYVAIDWLIYAGSVALAVVLEPVAPIT
jgi:hypothetical protein